MSHRSPLRAHWLVPQTVDEDAGGKSHGPYPPPRTSDQFLCVLIIEDNPGDMDLEEEMLSSDVDGSFSFVRATTLAEGLAKLDEGVDVVVTNLGLPDIAGVGAVSTLLNHSPKVPVVVLTGCRCTRVWIAAFQAGAEDLLVKGTFDSERLKWVLRFAVERKRIETASR